MAKARIALAICGWGWILAMGLWCAGKTRHFRAGCKAGALRRCAGDALVLQAMQGLHLTADLHGCRRAQAWLPDAPLLGGGCLDAARAAGLQPVGQLFHGFAATAQGLGGVTATVLLVSRHRSSVGLRWPSKRIAALHRLPIRLGMGKRCALRCAPMAARSLRHLIRDATLAFTALRPARCAACGAVARRRPTAVDHQS